MKIKGKKKILTVIVLCVVLGVAWRMSKEERWSGVSKTPEPMENEYKRQNILVGEENVVVDIADTAALRIKGLSGRESLGENEGMLFIFPEDGLYSFWMEDMKFSIDILWIDADKRVVGPSENVSPETYPQTFSPPSPVRYVLEVRDGWVDAHMIKIGEKITCEEQ